MLNVWAVPQAIKKWVIESLFRIARLRAALYTHLDLIDRRKYWKPQKVTSRDSSRDDEEPFIQVDPLVLVPEGDYIVRYLTYRTSKSFGQPKVEVTFIIDSPEEHRAACLERFYNVEELDGPERKKGKFKPSRRGHLMREYSALVGSPSRQDRMSLGKLKGLSILAKVVTVKVDSNKDLLPKSSWYSKIEKLIKVVETDKPSLETFMSTSSKSH